MMILCIVFAAVFGGLTVGSLAHSAVTGFYASVFLFWAMVFFGLTLGEVAGAMMALKPKPKPGNDEKK